MSTLEAEEAKKCLAQGGDIVYAAREGLWGAVRHFLKEDPMCVKKTDKNRQTALHLAAIKGGDSPRRAGSMVELLLKHGADAGAKNNDGDTALHEAARHSHGSIVELLLKHGVDSGAKNTKGNTALHLAALNGRDSPAELLLKHGADAGAKNNDGNTALLFATLNFHSSIVELLLKHGVDSGAKNNVGNTALHLAVFNGRDSIAELLLKHGAPIEAKDKDGAAPLHLAARLGRGSLAELLLKHKADIDAKNNSGNTALHYAASKVDSWIAELLLKHGADAGAKDNDGSTALFVAALNGRDFIAELLLEHGADAGAKNSSGNTALHLAALSGKDSMAELLLKHGADIDAKDKDGKKPVDVAKTDEIKALLCKAEEARQPPESASIPLLAGAAGPALLKVKAKESEAAEAIEIPDGTNAPVSMFSARFDGGEIEQKFREVHKLLTEHNFANRMVSASGSDDFGIMTLKCLGEIKSKRGVMIAVCTPHYGEMTKSPYSSNAELRFALDERIKVLPLKVADIYPPEPPGGPGHPFDPDDTAKTMCLMVFKGSVVYLDCVNKSVQEITAMIANALLKM